MGGRRYLVELGSVIAFYAVVLFMALPLIDANPEAWWRFPLALAPMVPAVFIPLVVMRRVTRMDELQRRITFEALAFAFVGTALLTLGYGFLQLVGFPQASWLLVWPVMGALWLVGSLLANRRYK